MLQCGLQGYKMCSNPNEFFFWDLFHPSEHTYGLLAEDLWAGNEDQIRPINLKALACNTTFSWSCTEFYFMYLYLYRLVIDYFQKVNLWLSCDIMISFLLQVLHNKINWTWKMKYGIIYLIVLFLVF